MKKVLAFILIVSIVSCKKKDETPNYHFTFTVDGVNKSFTGSIAAHMESSNSVKALTILAANSFTDTDNYLGFELTNTPGLINISSGSYKDSATNYSVNSTFAINSKESNAGQFIYQNTVSNNTSIEHPFLLTITSIDKTSVKGTFSGDYYEEGDVRTVPKRYITNGDFYVPFK